MKVKILHSIYAKFGVIVPSKAYDAELVGNRYLVKISDLARIIVNRRNIRVI
jgi:hypothetical protein